MKLKKLWNATKHTMMGTGLMLAGTTAALADDTDTLSTMTGNVNHMIGDVLQMVSIAGVGVAIIFGFIAFNHLRQHASDQGGQGKHLHKGMLHAVVAVGFLSVPAVLHMVQNTLVKQDAANTWSIDSGVTNNTIEAETGG